LEQYVQVTSLGNGPAVVSTGVARRDAPQTAGQNATAPPDIKYSSPTLKYDPQSRLVVFQVLNPETGDVVRQYPSQRVVKLYQDGSDLGGSPPLNKPIVGVDPDAGKSKSPATSSTAGVTVPAGQTAGVNEPAGNAAPPAGEATPHEGGDSHATPPATGGSVKIEA
jgi:hypothetical protein